MPQYSYKNEFGNWAGYYIDIVTILAERNNLKLELIECPFARCLTLAESGDVDILGGLIKTPERQKYLKYIEPSSDIDPGLYNFYYLADSQNQDVTEISQLENKFVGTLRGARHPEIFEDHKQTIKVELVDYQTIVKLLLVKRIDYVIYSGNEFDKLLTDINVKNLIKKTTLEIKSTELGYFGLSNKSADLLVPLSKTFLQLVQSGQLKILAQKYGLD